MPMALLLAESVISSDSGLQTIPQAPLLIYRYLQIFSIAPGYSSETTSSGNYMYGI